MSGAPQVFGDVIYGENVTYAPATGLLCRDSGPARHAIDRAGAQFPNCRVRSLCSRSPDRSRLGNPTVKLVSIPANPVPEGAVVTELRTPDGVSLRAARWSPPPGRKGTVCLFQGRTETIEKYFEVVRDLRARGFAVATLDWRGQGLSQRALKDPFKGHLNNFAEYDTDLATFMQQMVLPDCPPPYFAIGHSTGGSVLLRAAHGGQRWFDRIVLSAPLIRLAQVQMLGFAGPLARAMHLLRFGRLYVPGGGPEIGALQPFVGNPVTSDPVRYTRFAAVIEADRSLALGSPTIAWADAAFRAMAQFARPTYSRQIAQPILVIAAGNDAITSTAATESFAIHLRGGAHLLIPGAQHELLMEQDIYRQQFWAAFDAFVPGTPLY
jgi:lysophospholipase